MKKVLEVKNLKKSYGKFEAVKGISFDVEKNQIFALIGPNGAGKSTTLKMIATLLSPTDGTIKVAGYDIVKNPEKIRELISYLPEEAGAYKNMTGSGYLNFMASLYAANKSQQKEFFERGEEISCLKDRLKDKISTYSKGMSRKILLARTVMINPTLAILDEPTSGLDIINAMEIRKIIRDLSEKGMAVLLSSHNMLEIEYLSENIAIIDKGIIHETGTSKDLKEKYKAQNLEEVFVRACLITAPEGRSKQVSSEKQDL